MCSRPARLWLVLAALAAAMVWLPSSPGRAAVWQDEYRRALNALESGRLDVARRALERAVAEHPRSETTARTYGARTLGYFPYLQLSIVAYRERDLAEAERYLALARTEGAAADGEQGRILLRKHELLLENLRFLRSASPSEGAVPAAGGEPQRTEADVRRERVLSRLVATQCGQPPRGRPGARPWYYHYLLADELSEHGDWLGSLQHLALALERRDRPSEFARTYGMSFVSYRPWFEIGRAHWRLGSWQCAVDALELSAALEQFAARDDVSRRERAELLAGARLHLQEERGE